MVVGGGEDLAGFGFVLVVVVDVLDLVVGMEFLFDVCLDVCCVVIVEGELIVVCVYFFSLCLLSCLCARYSICCLINQVSTVQVVTCRLQQSHHKHVTLILSQMLHHTKLC